MENKKSKAEESEAAGWDVLSSWHGGAVKMWAVTKPFIPYHCKRASPTLVVSNVSRH